MFNIMSVIGNVKVLIFLKDRFVIKTTTKKRKRNDRFLKSSFF